jgi:hypothetical protein
MNYAVVNNNTVINVIVWDGVTPFNAGLNNTLVQIQNGVSCTIGDTYNGTTFQGQ